MKISNFTSIVKGVVAILFVSGCSSTNNKISPEHLAGEVVKEIIPNLPIQSDNYTLVIAKTSGREVDLGLIYDDVDGVKKKVKRKFSTAYQQQMCLEPEIKYVISSGVSYRVTINNKQGEVIEYFLVNTSVCKNDSNVKPS